jgi:putative PEP-CTERM system TPR-repeat lipoprotein
VVARLQLAAPAALLALVPLAACDPRGGASVEQLVKKAQEQRAAGNVRASIIELKNALQKEPNNAAARLALGQNFVDIGDVASAEIELKRARELGADAARVAVLLGEAKGLQGRWDQVLKDVAVPETGAAAAKAVILELRGRAHLALGQRVQAEEAFKAALSHDDKYVEAMVGLARIAAATSKSEVAADYLQKAASLQPDNAKLLDLQGDLALAKKDFEAAENAYKQILKSHKDDLIALNAQLGASRAQIAGGKQKDAIARLTQVLKMAPKHPEANFLRALAAYQGKDYQTAKTHAEVALASAPNHRQSLFLAGASNYALGQDETALRYLTSFVNAVPDSVEGRKLLAALQLRMGEPAKASRTLQAARTQDAQMLAMAGAAAARAGDPGAAKSALERAVAAEPNDARTRTQLGLARISLGEVDEGIKDLEAGAQLDPGSVAEIPLAAKYLQEKSFDKALESAKRIQEKQPQRAVGYNIAGLALLGKNDVAQAKAAFAKAFEIEPGDRAAGRQLARIAISEKDFDTARRYYDEILKKFPTDAGTLVLYGELEALTNRPQQAMARLEAAVAANPSSDAARVSLARFQLLSNQPEKALQTIEPASKRLESSPAMLEVVGLAHLRRGAAEDAVKAFEALTRIAPQSPKAYVYLAEAHEASGQFDRALESVEKAVQLEPANANYKFEHAKALANAGRMDDAGKVVAELKGAYPANANVHVLEGGLAQVRNDYAAAVAAYRQALAIEKSNINVLRLFRAQRAAGQASEAEQTLRDWLAQQTGDVVVRTALADSYLRAGRLPEAEAEYQEVLKHAPANAVAMNNLAWIRLERGRPDEALPLARKAVELMPANAAALDTLGLVLLKLGNNKDEAIDTFKRANERAPDNRAIQINLAQALAAGGKRAEAREILKAVLSDTRLAGSDRARADQLMRELGS